MYDEHLLLTAVFNSTRTLHKKIKFSIKDFIIKPNQIHKKLAMEPMNTVLKMLNTYQKFHEFSYHYLFSFGSLTLSNVLFILSRA